MCCFDLEKAFDSVEYSVLLKHLFDLGINGKCWRLLHSWYSNSMNIVKLDNAMSESFTVSRGVKQGSVLSPTLFIVIMDSLLKFLDYTHQGLSLLSLDVGSSAHADDIRICCNCADAVTRMGLCIDAFCSTNSLQLNSSKTEAVTFSKSSLKQTTLNIAGHSITSQPQVKCLGVWWHHNLSPCISVEENICKARRAFFATGSMGSFQGKLNPLSGRSILECFVIPVLLYGCETWILTSSLITKLEKLQSELGRRILGLTRYHADLSPLIGLHLPSIKARILMRKLSFLAKLLAKDEDTQSVRVFHTISADNIYSISLVQQCEWLQCELGTEPILQKCLADPVNAPSITKGAKNIILHQDWANIISSANQHQSLKHILGHDPDLTASGWCRIWDLALDYGYRGTKLAQCLFRCLCKPLFGDRMCPHCNTQISSNLTYFEHLCSRHIDFDIALYWRTVVMNCFPWLHRSSI